MLQFLEWLASKTALDTKSTITQVKQNSNYLISIDNFLVLVAHNGFSFNFPILLAEVERHVELHLSAFLSANIHFSDTLLLLWKVFTIVKKLSFIYHVDEEGW